MGQGHVRPLCGRGEAAVIIPRAGADFVRTPNLDRLAAGAKAGGVVREDRWRQFDWRKR